MADKHNYQGNLKGAPSVLTPSDLQSWAMTCSRNGGPYVPLRPAGLPGWAILKRLKLAYEVFTGRSDVLRWPMPPSGQDTITRTAKS